MDIVNNSSGLITSYHMLDAVVREMLHIPLRLHSQTPTHLAVYCVLELHHSDGWWLIIGVTVYPKMPSHFIKILCFYILDTIIFGQADYITFITVASGCLCFVMALCMPYVCIVSVCAFA